MRHVLLWAEDSEAELAAELRNAMPESRLERHASALLEAEFAISFDRPLPQLAFLRQLLPEARVHRADSIREWTELLLRSLAAALPEDEPWRLHISPHYGETTPHHTGARAWHSQKLGARGGKERREISKPLVDTHAGRRRCELIHETLVGPLRQKRRGLLKALRAGTSMIAPDETLVQLLLTAPESGFLSIAPPPLPHLNAHLISSFPLGDAPLLSDPQAPSRAFAKLAEAEMRMGRKILRGEACVDLGAAPGGWTYVALQRGAIVTAVDRTHLREDLMTHSLLRFVTGNAFEYRPKEAVDWLLCDVIAEPMRSGRLLLDWLGKGLCRNFVVTLKIKEGHATDILATLRSEMPRFSNAWQVKKLTANKKEVCVFGARPG